MDKFKNGFDLILFKLYYFENNKKKSHLDFDKDNRDNQLPKSTKFY